MSGLVSVAFFLMSLFFALVLFLLWARILLRFFGATPSQAGNAAIIRLTNAFVKPFQRIFNTHSNAKSPYDLPALASVITLVIVKLVLYGLFLTGGFIGFGYLLVYLAGDLIVRPCNALFYCVLLTLLMSWIRPDWKHPVVEALWYLSEPVLKFTRRFVRPIADLDLAPLVAMVALKAIVIFIEATLSGMPLQNTWV